MGRRKYRLQLVECPQHDVDDVHHEDHRDCDDHGGAPRDGDHVHPLHVSCEHDGPPPRSWTSLDSPHQLLAHTGLRSSQISYQAHKF